MGVYSEHLRQRYQQQKEAASAKIKARLTQPSSWKLPRQPSSIAPPDVWTNGDQDPVPVERRTWTSTTFIYYWFSDLITLGGWAAAASVISTGLSTTDTIICLLVAGICNAFPTVLNGAIGADLHIPFPIVTRASYGYWFSYFCVFSRAVLGLFWFGVAGGYGGQCITTIITAIWPSYAKLPNHLPASAGLTTQGMVSYFIYNLIQFPCLLIPTHKLQKLFLIKTILVPPVALATIIWLCVKASSTNGGASVFNQPATVHGSARAWLFLSNLTSLTGGFTTLTVNIPDFSRFSKTRGAQVWQLPFIPFYKVIIAIFGIAGAGASKALYGQMLWNPLSIIAMWQDSPGGRAAAFFSAVVWLVSQIAINISSNSISFANDITTLFPLYFNIRRGVIFAALIGGWAMCPWIIIVSATSFLSFMSAYGVFMGPIAGIMCVDYWLVKRRKYDVPALYNPRGIYRYQSGVNWRAFVATFTVMIPVLPGLAYAVSPSTVHINQGLKDLYSINWLFSFFTSSFLFWILNVVFPHRPSLIEHVVPGVKPTVDSINEDVEGQLGNTEKTPVVEEVAKDPKEISVS